MANSRSHLHEAETFAQKAADIVAASMGSWAFIIIQSAIVGSWILLNIIAIIGRWDPYPFILLNLLFSTQAAYAAPIIMMSQNRQAYKDQLRDNYEAQEVDLLFRINQHQLDILQLLREKISPDTPKDSEGEQKLFQQSAKLEARAHELESELGLDPFEE